MLLVESTTGIVMFFHVLIKLLRIITRREYDISPYDLAYIYSKGGKSFLRGLFWSAIRLRKHKSLFLGSNISFLGEKYLEYGYGCSIGVNSYIECYAKEGVHFGDGVTIRENAWIQCRSGLNEPGEKLTIDKNCYIGPFAVFGVGGEIEIGESCQIGARLTLSAESHKKDGGDYVSGKVSRRGISIGPRCWLGNNVTILDGVSIGENCVVGAGAVVTKSIPSDTVVYGVPAKPQT